MKVRIEIDMDKIGEFCRQNHIRWLVLFGSVLRDDFTPESDIDVLIEFEPNHIPGLAFFGMQDDLSNLLGRQVDLYTPDSLSRHLRPQALANAETLYVAA
jgi:predicted nucleotidyltransferase